MVHIRRRCLFDVYEYVHSDYGFEVIVCEVSDDHYVYASGAT